MLEKQVEIWKPIRGFEDYYEVSDFGKVRSVDRVVERRGSTVKLHGRLLAPRPQVSGHLAVCLSRNGVVSQYRVHTLVLGAFVGEKPGNMECLHKDGNAKNNELSNLRWGTSSENRKDAYRHGTMKTGSESHLAKYSDADVMRIRELKGSCSSRAASRITGINDRYIRQLWSGEIRSAK